MQIQVKSERVISIVTPGNNSTAIITLKPGINNIDSKLWDLVKDSPGVQALTDESTFKMIEPRDGPAHEVLNLSKRKLPEAKELIKDILDIKVLDQLELREAKPELREAIREQKIRVVTPKR